MVGRFARDVGMRELSVFFFHLEGGCVRLMREERRAQIADLGNLRPQASSGCLSECHRVLERLHRIL